MGKGGKGKGKDKGKTKGGAPLAAPIPVKDAFSGIEQSEVAFSELEQPPPDQGKGKGKGKGGKDGKAGKDGKKGKEKIGKKGGGMTATASEKASAKKKKRKALEALEDVDFDIPKMAERQVVQGNVDPKMLESLRKQAIERKAAVKQENDPADFTRRYNCAVNVTGVRNTTDADWEVFMAILLAKPGTAGVKSIKIKNKYAFSKSQVVPAGQTKMFKVAEKIYFQVFQGSYKELQQQEIRIDLWVVQTNNFNQHLGTSMKNLYQAGCEPVYQSVPIKMYKDERSATDGGVLFLNAMVSEIMKTQITCSNWTYQPKPGVVDRDVRSLTFAVPCGNGGLDRQSTEPCAGPRYSWMDCGCFHYVGTKIALMCEAMSVTVDGAGKAIINLAGAGDFPIATGAVKTMCDNPANFEQGIVGGAISVLPRSLLLDDDDIDEDPSIPAPNQPTTSILMYTLDPNCQYLLVDVVSAEGLPIGDEDIGQSNPFVRVRYDGMAQSSGTVEGTIRPVWNHNFFIPMRYIDKEMLSNARFFNTLLPAELKSKGYLEIEVWHMDGVPTEFLGAFRLDPRQIRFGDEENRSVCQKLASLKTAKADDDSDDGEEDSFGVDPKLMKKHKTHVFRGNRVKLLGSRLQCQTVPRITFECCFVPDFPANLDWPEQQSAQSMAQLAEVNERWNEKFTTHGEQYEAWFPDCPKNRRFMNTYTTAQGETRPLPQLIRSLALPQSLSGPGKVLHWVRCFEFTVSAKQKGKGQISGWNETEAILALRKGPVQDHGVILCAALQGLKKDSWVVKGTVRGGQEHVWCMTREQGGFVTFWETTTGAKYHLPGRWANDPSHGPPSLEAVNARWSRRRVIPDWREEARNRAEVGRRQQLRDMENLTRLPFSPFMELTTPQMIVPLPYESIEVVFNDKQLYANLTNHHPSCIFYDMEKDPRSWEPYLGPKEIKELTQANSGGVGIPVGPTISDYVSTQMEHNIEIEVKESIRMTRIRKGYETSFDEGEVLREVLLQYLSNLEREIRLDIDWQYDRSGAAQKPPGHPSPFNSQMYVSQCQQEWGKYWSEKDRLDANQVNLPVKENHVASAVPFHFSGTDLKEIRCHLMDCKPVLEYLNIANDDNQYFVCAKIFPMANSVASVWCWVGVQMPIPIDQVFELSTQEGLAKQIAKDKGKGKDGKGKGKGKDKGKDD